MRRLSFVGSLACAIAALALPSGNATAQSIWQSHTQPNRIGLEFLMPNLDGPSSLEFPSGTTTLSIHQRIQDQLAFVFEMPLASLNTEFDDISVEPGHPYIGLESIPTGPAVFYGEFGIRPNIMTLDVSDDGAGIIGLITNQDAWEAFVEATTVSGAVNYRYQNPQGQGYRIRVSPSYWIPEEGDGELVLSYSGQFFFETPGAGAQMGLSGRSLLTQDNADKTTYFEFGLQGSINFDGIRPGVLFKIPLGDDLFELTDFVWGFRVEFLPKS